MASSLLLFPIIAQLNPVVSYLQLNAFVVEKKTQAVAFVIEKQHTKTEHHLVKNIISKPKNNRPIKQHASRSQRTIVKTKTTRTKTKKRVKTKPSTRSLMTDSIVYFPYLEPTRNSNCKDHTCFWLNDFISDDEDNKTKKNRRLSKERVNGFRMVTTRDDIDSIERANSETGSAIDCKAMPLLCHEPIDKNDQDRDVVTLLDDATDNELADTRMEYAVDQLDGTLFVSDSVYILGAYNSLQAKENDELKVEVTKYSLGAGVKLAVNDDFGFHSTVSYNHYQIDKQDTINENNEFTYGYTFSAGAVGYITEDLEIGGDIVYQQFDFKGDPNTDAKYYFSTRYRLFKSAWLSYNLSANAEVSHVLELRFEF